MNAFLNGFYSVLQ